MPAKKYLAQVSGNLVETAATVTSAGAGDDGKIPALDATGRLDASMMPVGVAADTKQLTASEALAAGDLINVWNSSGAKMRKADAATAGKEAHGFVLAAVSNGATGTAYFEGTDTQLSGLTAGVAYLSTTPGLPTATPPSASGNIVQRVGFAVSATELNFQSQPPITLA